MDTAAISLDATIPPLPASKQKFKFVINAEAWDSERDIFMYLSHQLEWKLHLWKIYPINYQPTRVLSFDAEFLNQYYDIMKQKSIDRICVDVLMRKNEEITYEKKFEAKFDVHGKPYGNYECVLSHLTQIDLFDEDRKFILEATVYPSSRKKDVTKQAVGIHKLQMKDILNHHQTSDVKIISNEHEFKCHRNIISCRVPAFAMMLRGETAENQTSTINIGDWHPEVVQLMIEYLYTGVIPDVPARIEIDLLKLAVKYDLTPLAESCGFGVIKNLTVENFLPTYAELDLHGHEFPRFKEEALEFFKKNCVQIVKREDYLEFSRDFALLNQQLFIAVGSMNRLLPWKTIFTIEEDY